MQITKTAGAVLLCYSLLVINVAAAANASSIRPNSVQDDNGMSDLEAFGKKSNLRNVDYVAALMDAPVLDIVWCGNGDESVLVLSDKGSVYSTKNFGKNWTGLREEFSKTECEGANAPGKVIKIL